MAYEPPTFMPYEPFLLGVGVVFNRGPKKAHKLFQHNFFGPHPKHPCWAPRKKVYVPHFLGKDTKKGPTYKLFGGILGVKKGSQTGHFWPQNV